MGNRTVTRRLFWQPRLSTRTVRTVGDALPETRVGSRTGETTANNAIRVPRGAIPPPREASSAVPSNPPAAMKHHRSSDGPTVDRIAVGATASTDDARAVGGASTVCEVRVDGGDVEPKIAQSPGVPRLRPSNDERSELIVSGSPGLRPRFAPTLPAPRADALIRAADAPADAPIDALRRALTAELRDRKVRVDSLAAADAALGAGSADGNVDATLRRDARFRRPGRDKPPAWVERLVAFVDDAPVFRTRGGGADGGASGPGACTRETIGALERWVDASVERVCREGGDASRRANRAPAHPH